MKTFNLSDRYPWAANHEQAIRTVALFLGRDLESVFQAMDNQILAKIAQDQLNWPKAA